MSGATLLVMQEQGEFASLETEKLDELSLADLMRRLSELGERDPDHSIDEIKSYAFRSLGHAEEMAKQVEAQTSWLITREDLRRISKLMREYASHAIGELSFLKVSMEKNDLQQAVHHALRAGHFAAMTKFLYHEPNAAFGKRQRPKPTKAGRARKWNGETMEKRYRMICEVFSEVTDDPEFPKKTPQVMEVARRCDCSERTVFRALSSTAADKKDP